MTLPESTPLSQTIPSFSTTICDPPRIYPSLPKYTPLFNNYMRPSQNLPLPPRIYPLFHNHNTMRPSQNLHLSPRLCPPFQQLYATLSEYTPPSQNILPFSTNLYVRPSQNLSLPPRIYPPPLSRTIRFCDPPKICPSLPEYFSVLGASGRFSHSHM